MICATMIVGEEWKNIHLFKKIMKKIYIYIKKNNNNEKKKKKLVETTKTPADQA